MSDLIPLSPHPSDLPWPKQRWPERSPGADVDCERLESALDRVFAQASPEQYGETLAFVAIHRGALVCERYGPEQGADTTLISWSMAKSILHAAVGILVREGRLDITDPVGDPCWQQPNDARAELRFDQLLRMASGLHFFEDYVDERGSDCIRMLFGRGKADVAAYAADQRLEHQPDTFWNYSSGTTNILSAAIGRVVGGGRAGIETFLRDEIFDRIGMGSATLRFDDAGTWIASSFVFASARDFARFGYLYLRDGVWEGERVLPEGWVDNARSLTACSNGEYGSHWWLALDGSGRFHASGYQGQYIVVDPARDLVVVRLGVSTPEQRVHVLGFMRDVVESFPERTG